MDPPQHSSGSQDSAEKLDLPPSSLFVPKFTKAREPRPLNRDGTPMNHELTRVPSAADLPPLPCRTRDRALPTFASSSRRRPQSGPPRRPRSAPGARLGQRQRKNSDKGP